MDLLQPQLGAASISLSVLIDDITAVISASDVGLWAPQIANLVAVYPPLCKPSMLFLVTESQLNMQLGIRLRTPFHPAILSTLSNDESLHQYSGPSAFGHADRRLCRVRQQDNLRSLLGRW